MGWNGKHTMAAAAFAGVAALFLWGPGTGDAPILPPGAASPASGGTPANAAAAASAASGPSAGAPAGIADPFLTADLRHRLEEMIQEALAGTAPGDAEALKARVLALVGKHFPQDMAARASALATRYVDYRAALGKVALPADPTDPRALRAAVEERQRLQRRHFTGEEYDVLFAKEAELDRYTLARLEIERHPGLTPAQKDAALRSAERELDEKERAARLAATQHLDAAAQTSALNARNASDAEKFAAREASYGQAAARELEKLDREDRDWQARLSEYAYARTRLTPQELQQFRDARFTVQEQMRLEAALALRGVNPP